jgi:type IV secretion system protein VirB9
MKYATCFVIAASLALAANKKEAQPSSLAATQETVAASRVVRANDRDVIPIMTRLRFSTMIVLPKDETILQALTGDSTFWIVDGLRNIVTIKPSEAAHDRTNLNLITASGSVYSFALTLGKDNDQPDLKVIVEPRGGETLFASTALTGAAPRYVPADQIEDYRKQIEVAQNEAKQAREDAEREVAAAHKNADTKIKMAKAGMPAGLHFDYKYGYDPAFGIKAMWHDDRFTYIKADPKELPSLYEYRDKDKNLIQMQFADGLYTIPKILERSQLAMGPKKRLHIQHEEK